MLFLHKYLLHFTVCMVETPTQFDLAILANLNTEWKLWHPCFILYAPKQHTAMCPTVVKKELT